MAKGKKKSAQLDIEDAVREVAIGRPTEIHHTRLHPSMLNARGGDYSEDGIAELAAQIHAVSLLHPLLVCKSDGSRDVPYGDYEILDGERRHAAIGLLIEDGRWPGERPVPAIVRDGAALTLAEESLIANVAREPMHPVREYQVFAGLHAGGKDVDSIAKRYGTTARIVRQRLALGGLAPEIREAWRDGRINAETAQAFATCADQARQTKLFHSLAKNHQLQAWAVRQALTKDKPRINDSRIAFIGGLDAYRVAGGKVVESLFTDDGYLEDGELLQRLVSERMAARCTQLTAAGWSWAEPAEAMQKQGWWSWQRLRPGKVQYTADETAQLAALGQEENDLEGIEELTDEQSDRIDAIQEEGAAIRSAAEARAFSPAQKAKSGCVVDGDHVHYGVVRPGAKNTAAPTRAADPDSTEPDNDEDAGEQRISNSLMMSISEKQTVAAAKALAASPAAALAFAVAGLNSYSDGPIKITSSGWHGASPKGFEAGDKFAAVLADALRMTIGEREDALARALARALDLRRYAANDQAFGHRCDTPGIEALVAALPAEKYLANMRAEFDAGDFFRRSPATSVRAAIAEMTGGTRIIAANVKKAELAAIAADLAVATGWLPVELRHPDYKLKHHQDAADPAPGVKGRRKKKEKAA